ncbi:MAG TPA: GNVR domain-containing protein [Thermodesulfovibrionales bacterium]|nr:GNVR domain-containing protein [Thermodesulfovibrionales bacterium]
MKKDEAIQGADIIAIAKRRRWGLMVPALAVVLLSVAVVLVWEPVYRSTSTILIEEQEIPREYVVATVTSYAEQRLQSINQRIMSSARLLEVINRFNLYADKRNRLTNEEIIDDMRRKDIKFETVMADVIDRRTGQKTAATIAFTVSYEGKNPVVVQQVANVLASLYLEENIRVVGQQTASTSKFLADEMKSVQADLVSFEKRIAEYKERNPRSLPELLNYNLQTLDWTDRNFEQFHDQLRTLKEKESYLQSQLASIEPDAKNQDKDLLKDLRAKLVMLRSKYSDEYPDVKKTKTEIAVLEERLHTEKGTEPAPEKPDNPAYVALAAQLASTQSEIASVARQIKDMEKKREDYSRRLEMSPRVEEGYKNLMVERNNTQAKYDDLMKKFMEARVAEGLEKGQMGERFTLIDPARLPEKPVRPNRPLILVMGLIMGIGAGVGVAALQEANDRSARCAGDLAAAFPFPVLAEVPEIFTLEDELRKKKRRKFMIGTAVLLMVILVVTVHFLVMDLSVLFARVARRAPL